MINDHIAAVVTKLAAYCQQNALIVDLAATLVAAAVQLASGAAFRLVQGIARSCILSTAGVVVAVVLQLVIAKQLSVLAALTSQFEALKHNVLILRQNARPARFAALFYDKHLIHSRRALVDIARTKPHHTTEASACAARELSGVLVFLRVEAFV